MTGDAPGAGRAGPEAPRPGPLRGAGPSPFPPPLREFVRVFNEGRFWESHEVLEGPWRGMGSPFYQGLILFASAFVHLRRGNRHGILAQLDKAETRLRRYRPHYLGVDVEAVLETMARLGALAREAETEGHALAAAPMEPRLALSERCLRGSEPELDG